MKEKKAMKQSFTIAYGNPFDGIEFIGIFKDHNEALKYAEEFVDDTWWIVGIQPLPKCPKK